MITEEQIHTLAIEYLGGSGMFVVDISIKSGNRIAVYIDGLARVSVEQCIKLSRFLESQLDREKEDFDLTVSSWGADRPLKMPAQYQKNIGFQLEITPKEGDTITGTLIIADQEHIEIEVIEQKSKKKSDVEKKILTYKFSEIKTAKEVITFKK